MTLTTDAATAREHLRRARKVRSSWLARLDAGQATWQDVLLAATRPDGRPLLPIRLDTMLTHADHFTASQRDAAMSLLRRRLRVADTLPDAKLTVGWLLRTNANTAHRLSVVADVMDLHRGTRALGGYPYRVPRPVSAAWRGTPGR